MATGRNKTCTGLRISVDFVDVKSFAQADGTGASAVVLAPCHTYKCR